MSEIKYYAVRVGREPGIYDSWPACSAQVNGFSGAIFKSFLTRAEAQSYLDTASQDPARTAEDAPSGLLMEAYVDGSYNIRTGEYSYGAAVSFGGEEFLLSEKFPADEELSAMHNVAGELAGAMAAMRFALEKGAEELIIYHDYAGIGCWARGEWKTNKTGTKAYKAFCDSLAGRLSVRFSKVPGHSGVVGNELADRLAKQALGLE